MSQTFWPMGAQLSLKAAMPLVEILATCRKNVSNTGPSVATWDYRCSDHLKNNCIWDNLLYCLLCCSQIYTFNWTAIQYGRQIRHQAIFETKSEPNLGCCSNIAITISYISVFYFFLIISWLTELRLCQGHPVIIWRWPLTCDLEKCYLLRSSLDMYNL